MSLVNTKQHAIKYAENTSVFERFLGQIEGVAVIPFTKGISPQPASHFTQYASRMLLIRGDLHSFTDLACDRVLNPLKIKVNTLRSRHSRGCDVEHLFISACDLRSYAMKKSEPLRLAHQRRTYRKPVKTHFLRENLSRYGSRFNQRLNAVFSATLSARKKCQVGGQYV